MATNTNIRISQIIGRLMSLSNIPVDQLMVASGVGRNSLDMFLDGKIDLPRDRVERMLAYLGVEPNMKINSCRLLNWSFTDTRQKPAEAFQPFVELFMIGRVFEAPRVVEVEGNHTRNSRQYIIFSGATRIVLTVKVPMFAKHRFNKVATALTKAQVDTVTLTKEQAKLLRTGNASVSDIDWMCDPVRGRVDWNRAILLAKESGFNPSDIVDMVREKSGQNQMEVFVMPEVVAVDAEEVLPAEQPNVLSFGGRRAAGSDVAFSFDVVKPAND